MTEPTTAPRKRGPKRKPDAVSVARYIMFRQSDIARLDALPGNSTRERIMFAVACAEREKEQAG